MTCSHTCTKKIPYIEHLKFLMSVSNSYKNNENLKLHNLYITKLRHQVVIKKKKVIRILNELPIIQKKY